MLFWSHKSDVTCLVKIFLHRTSRRQVFPVNFDQACDVILWPQDSISRAVSQNKCFMINDT